MVKRVIQFAVTAAFFAAALCACQGKTKNLRQKGGEENAKSKESPAADSLIDRKSLRLSRVGDKQVAVLTFSTLKAAKCSVKSYAQDAGSEANAVSQPCSGDLARTSFTEDIGGLDPAKLYVFEVRAWLPEESEAQADLEVFREVASLTPNRSTGNLVVFRFSAPQRTASAYELKPNDPKQTSGDIDKLFSRKLGCTQGAVTEKRDFPDYSTPTTASINKITTRGFAQGQSQKHPFFATHQTLSYSVLQFAAPEWEFSVNRDASSSQMIVRPGVRFAEVTLESENKMTLGPAQLLKAEDILDIKADRPLKLTWKNDNLTELSFLYFIIGRSSYDKAISCVFDAQKGTGEVPQDLVAKLGTDIQVVLAQVESHQLLRDRNWVISTFDWRSLRIRKS